MSCAVYTVLSWHLLNMQAPMHYQNITHAEVAQRSNAHRDMTLYVIRSWVLLFNGVLQVFGVAKTRGPPDDDDSDGFESPLGRLRAQDVLQVNNMSAASAPKVTAMKCTDFDW
jgi:hypothetical protein